MPGGGEGGTEPFLNEIYPGFLDPIKKFTVRYRLFDNKTQLQRYFTIKTEDFGACTYWNSTYTICFYECLAMLTRPSSYTGHCSTLPSYTSFSAGCPFARTTM